MPALTITIGIALTLGGCETSRTSQAVEGQIILQKGMTADAVRALLGDPLSIKVKEGGFETWTYEDSRETTSLVQAETREVPYIHPISREATTLVEAVTKAKTDRITLTTDLIFYGGNLIRWKESTKESTFYHD